MKATVPWQGLSIDVAFTGQVSKDKACATATLGTKIPHIARFWSHITHHVICDLAYFQDVI